MPLFGDEPEERPARARVPRSRPSCLSDMNMKKGLNSHHRLPAILCKVQRLPPMPDSLVKSLLREQAQSRLFAEEPEERAASSGDSGSSPEDGHLDWSVLHKFREFNFMSKAKEALQAPPPKRAYDNSGRMKKAQEGLQKRPSGMLRDRALDKTRLRKLLSQRCLCS